MCNTPLQEVVPAYTLLNNTGVKVGVDAHAGQINNRLGCFTPFAILLCISDTLGAIVRSNVHQGKAPAAISADGFCVE